MRHSGTTNKMGETDDEKSLDKRGVGDRMTRF
jgi:hypothetical protein